MLALITPRTPPDAGDRPDRRRRRERRRPRSARRSSTRWRPLTPAARPAAILALLGRPDWTRALLDGDRGGQGAAVDLLTLDQKQALAAHPDRPIAERAKALLARGGGLPDPDRQKVIDAARRRSS